MEKEEVASQIKGHLHDLMQIGEESRRLRQMIYQDVAGEINEKTAALQRVQSRLAEEIQELEQEAQERNSSLYTQVELLSAQEAECRSEIARVGKLLSPEEGAEGLKVEQEGWKVAVSKIKTSIEYKTDDLLRVIPQFVDTSVDGDPLFERRVNKAVLLRLVATGEISEETIEPFRTVTAVRKPTVRIIVGETNE